MKRRYIIGMLAMALMIATLPASPALCRVVHSAQNFQHYFEDLKQGESSLSPVERFVFSLVLANSKAPQKTAVEPASPGGRT